MINAIFLIKLLVNLQSFAVLHHIYVSNQAEPGGVSVQGQNDKDSQRFNLKEPLSH